MESFPENFLKKIAGEYNLSEKQTEAFIALYTTGKSPQNLADELLHITSNAFSTRMTGVYQKFSFGGKSPNKSRKLHDLLLTKYQKYQKNQGEETTQNHAEAEANIKQIVEKARQIIRPDIDQKCSTMKVLDMNQPIKAGDIYTQVQILAEITARQRLGLAKLKERCNFDAEEFERFGFFAQKRSQRIDGLKAVKKHRKLMVWGKPGAGKTTFLKHLAVECIDGNFLSERVPIFITLKEFAETEGRPSLRDYINEKLEDREHSSINFQSITKLLQQGKLLIFLDGLDEVKQEHSQKVIREIQQFANKFYQNYFVITCRVAAKEYTFQGFTDVEVADFDQEQIKTFVNKWFKPKDPNKAENFLKKLADNEPIQELAANPLLLTLLCLVFEALNDFPKSRAELYQEGVDVLLKKWDASRNIKRENVYEPLSAKRKQDLLSQVAFKTFVQGNYFFKKQTAETYIGEFIINLPDARTDPEALRVDSGEVLKAIEAQHGLLVTRAKGIYSFSHLTFHEYFTAVKVVANSQQSALQENLVCHLTETRWREVFLLATERMEDATELVQLMKHQVDNLVAKDEKIQAYLTWLNEKTKSVNETYRPEDYQKLADCLGYAFSPGFNLSLSRSLYLDLPLSLDLYRYLSLSLSLDLSLDLDLDLSLSLSLSLDLSLYLSLDLSLDQSINIVEKINPDFAQKLQNLKHELPDREKEAEFKAWWQANGQAWTEKLREIMIKYRNIGHDWQFSQEQKELLNQYDRGNKLLLQCMSRECYVDREVRQQIQETLLLPISCL